MLIANLKREIDQIAKDSRTDIGDVDDLDDLLQGFGLSVRCTHAFTIEGLIFILRTKISRFSVCTYGYVFRKSIIIFYSIERKFSAFIHVYNSTVTYKIILRSSKYLLKIGYLTL